MPRLYPATPVTGKGGGGVIRATTGAFRRSSLAVTAGLVNRQRETDRKAPLMTSGAVSSAFISLQRIPRLVVNASLLLRAACGQRGSAREIGFGNGRIGGAGEDLGTALSLRRWPLSSASWRHRYRQCDLRCRPVRSRKTVDERRNGARKRFAGERNSNDPMIGGRIPRPAGRPESRSIYCEKLDLHKAVTDPPSRWPLKCHSLVDGCLKGAAPCKYRQPR